MPPNRRVVATFDRVRPHFRHGAAGVELGFRPGRWRASLDRIDDWAELGPELTIATVFGLGKVLRILRAARVVAPEPAALLGNAGVAADLLTRALGTELVLGVRPRSRLRFVAWTETGVETVEDVSEVVESEDAYLVLRRRGRFPVRLPRESVVRRRTERENWYEVLEIDRA